MPYSNCFRYSFRIAFPSDIEKISQSLKKIGLGIRQDSQLAKSGSRGFLGLRRRKDVTMASFPVFPASVFFMVIFRHILRERSILPSFSRLQVFAFFLPTQVYSSIEPSTVSPWVKAPCSTLYIFG